MSYVGLGPIQTEPLTQDDFGVRMAAGPILRGVAAQFNLTSGVCENRFA
jgi:hypothetical protein